MAHRFFYLVAWILWFVAGFLILPQMHVSAQNQAQDQKQSQNTESWDDWGPDSPSTPECGDLTWKCYWSTATPINILNDIRSNGKTDIVNTRLDDVQRSAWMFGEPQWKIADTLDSVRQNLAFYLQWIMFIWLAWAVMFIMINGIRLMVMPLSPSQAGTVKKRILYVVLGILLMTWFYFIYKIFLSVYAEIFVD